MLSVFILIIVLHGGGFAGTILTIIRNDKTQEYNEYMSKYFGRDNVFKMNVRKYGVVELV